MLLLMTFLACEEQKTYNYDVSSTIIVTDENGLAIQADNVEFCQRFQSEDYDTRTGWEVSSEQCNQVSIENGIATLPNWEGEYFGHDVSMKLELHKDEEVYEAQVFDSDAEVWCDNELVTEFDEYGDPVHYESLCAEDYERYLVWSLVVPIGLFDDSN